MINILLRIWYHLLRGVIRLIAKPDYSGLDNLEYAQEPNLEEYCALSSIDHNGAKNIVYVLEKRSISDLLVLEHGLTQATKPLPPSPLETLRIGEFSLNGRALALNRAWGGRVTMQRYSRRLLSLMRANEAYQKQISLVPVSIFWGRSLAAKGSWIEALTSDQRTATGGIKRFFALLFNGGDIHIYFGKPIALEEIAHHEKGESFAIRRTARLLRIRFKQQRKATLGPDFSHRRTLITSVANAPRVTQLINQTLAASEHKQKEQQKRMQKNLAFKHAKKIASDMSYSTIRLFLIFLSWFWRRIYTGINVRGLASLREVTETHTLVYVPSHRSHIDYLVLSYTLYRAGIMLPHIAAGDNLNLPILGGFLRRGGAFFMRRSFKDDPLYAAVLDEYLYQVYNSGHCVEFFPEGGRSRSGRLLPIKYGLLKLSLAHHFRGLDKPLAFVPVYFGYEKVIEGSSYVDELRGANKKTESILDLINGLKLVQQNFGQLQVNFGEPIKLDQWLAEQNISDANEDSVMKILGRKIMGSINAEATINSVNVIALASSSIDQAIMEEKQITEQSECYMDILRSVYGGKILATSDMTGKNSIEKVRALGLINQTTARFGPVFSYTPFNTLQMNWYRNNVLHLIALPSLVAGIILNRREPICVSSLEAVTDRIFPFIAHELSVISPPPLDLVVDALTNQGLIINSDGQIKSPNRDCKSYLQLGMLSNLMSETLGRMYLLSALVQQNNQDRRRLSQQSALTAEKISILLGIDGPEFFDQKLITLFLDRLIESHFLSLEAKEFFSPSAKFNHLRSDLGAAINYKLKLVIDAECAATKGAL